MDRCHFLNQSSLQDSYSWASRYPALKRRSILNFPSGKRQAKKNGKRSSSFTDGVPGPSRPALSAFIRFPVNDLLVTKRRLPATLSERGSGES